MEKVINDIKQKISQIIYQRYDSGRILIEIYKLLSNYLPIDTMSMAIYRPDIGILNYKAFVINKKAILLDESIQISATGQKTFGELIANTISPLAFNNSQEISYAKEVINFFRVKDSVSTLIFYTKTGIKKYAGLVFAAYGQNRYQPEHIAFANLLNDVFVEVIHQILLQLKENRKARQKLSKHKEIRDLLEYQRIDLVLNSQNGLRNILNQIEQVAPLDSPVLITGETGVGKELAANLLHGASNRMDGPFVCVNCGAIPESLLDSELFGYEKGAFTGAGQMRAGYFEQANKGSLFLDEVGELTLAAQVKLLRALQNKMIQRVGGTQTIPVDVRVIAATNRDLLVMIKEKKFRPDLWYRLNVFPIEIPPLRKRKTDIPALVQYMINNKLFEMNLPFQPVLGNRAMEQLINYNWPGNVRELQNVIERALILCKGAPLTFLNLSENVSDQSQDIDNHGISDEPFLTMAQMMVIHIQKSLTLSKGKIDGPGGAAELLDMNPSTLRARIRKLGIEHKRFA